MLSKNTSRILLYLLKNLDDLGYNINQIAKLNNISVASAFKILKDLENNGIISKKEISNASHYTLNLDNPETIKLCELLLLAERRTLTGYAKIYADEIVKFKEADMIVMFGSVLREKEFNDVDVLFLTNQTKKVNDFCLELSKVRTTPVVPLIMTREDLIQALDNRKEAILGLIKESVVLRGESIFVEVIKHVNS